MKELELFWGIGMDDMKGLRWTVWRDRDNMKGLRPYWWIVAVWRNWDSTNGLWRTIWRDWDERYDGIGMHYMKGLRWTIWRDWDGLYEGIKMDDMKGLGWTIWRDWGTMTGLRPYWWIVAIGSNWDSINGWGQPIWRDCVRVIWRDWDYIVNFFYSINVFCF